MAVGPELRLLNLHFFNICRHHPTLKFKPHATDDERYVSGIDGVPLKISSNIYRYPQMIYSYLQIFEDIFKRIADILKYLQIPTNQLKIFANTE